MTNGVSHTATIGAPGEIDAWTFSADQGDHLYVKIGESGVLTDAYYPWIRLIGPTGAILGTDWNTATAGIVVEAPLTGVYTVQTAAQYPATGAYRVTLAKSPGVFQVGGGDEGGPLTNGEIHPGHLDMGDIDMWSFSAAQGDAVYLRIGEIMVGAGQVDPGFYPWMRLVGPNGDILGTDWNVNAAGIFINAPLTGAYTVLVSPYYQTIGDYRLTLAKAPGAFVVPDGDEGGPLTNGLTHPGLVDHGDIDMWSFSAAQGDSLYLRVAEVLVPPGTPDPGFYPWIRLIGPNGNILDTNWHSLDTAVAVSAPLAGTYTVMVAAYYHTSGEYALTLSKAPGAFQVDAGDQGGPLTNGLTALGRAELGDVDMWSFSAAQGDSLYVRMGERPVDPTVTDPGFYPWLQLVGPNGNILATNWADLDAAVAVSAPLTGTYTLRVGSYYATTGDYRLTLAKAPGAFQIGVGDQGGALTNNIDYVANVELGDVDMWSFGACQGQSVTLTMSEIPVDPSIPDPGFYPWFQVIGPTGTVVATSWNTNVTATTFSPTLSGTYTVRSGAYYATVGDYRLRLLGGCAPTAPPVSVDDVYVTAFNTPLTITAPGVMLNDTGGVTVAVVSSVSSGTLALNPNGGFTYTPTSTFSGSATFTYRASNAGGPGNVATVTITVQGAGLPVAQPNSYIATRDQALVVPAPGVLSNDTSPNGSALVATLSTPPSSGGVTLSSNGGFTYTPNTGFVGIDTFSYRVSNTTGQGNVATVTIDVQTPPTTVQAPTALIAHSIVGNLVTLRWTAPATGPAPTGYRMDGGVAPGQALAQIPTGSRVPIFTFAAPNGSFYLRLHSLNGGQTSGPSNEILVRVNQPVAPSAPSDLLGLVNGSAVALSWRPTFGGGAASSYVLDVSGTLSASLPLGLTDSFVFNGVPGGSYTFRVRAVNAFGASAGSNSVPLNFPAVCSGAPQTPADFLAYNVGNTVNLLWNPAAAGPAQTSFVLRVTGAFNLTLPLPTRGISSPVPPGSYTFTVSATNACGSSAQTAPQTVVVP